MAEDIRDKYISKICESCNGRGVIWGDRYRGDEECDECDGEGMIWVSSEDDEGEDDGC